MKLFVEGDRLILDLGGRKQDVLLSCSQAEKLSAALRELACVAEQEEPSLATQIWSARVISYDGLVCIRFWPPVGVRTTEVPLSVAGARALAEQLDFVRSQAQYRIRFARRGA